MNELFPPGCAERYQHVKELAQGGFGTVHLARQVKLNREVVVKLLHAEGLEDPDLVTRFRDEARVTASLSHPAIVSVIDCDVEGGVPWIAYEFLPGRGMDAVLRAGALPWRTVLDLGVQIAEALDEAHRHGVLHRDVKPANIMEAGPGLWKLTDFGVARWSQATRMLTRTGEVVGTMGYIAPELMEGEEPAPVNDVFSLGVTLYELLLGHHPYEGNIVRLLQLKAAREWIAPPCERVAGVPAGLDAAIMKAVVREPAQRFASAGDFAKALRAVVAPRAARSSGAVVRAPPPPVVPTDRPSGVERLRPWMVAAAFTALGVGIGATGILTLGRPAPLASATPSVAAEPARPAIPAVDKAAIRAAMESDLRFLETMRPRVEALDRVMVGSMTEKLPEIARGAAGIVEGHEKALEALQTVERLVPATTELEPDSSDLARRYAKAILYHHMRLARFRQSGRIAQDQINEGGDNIFGSTDWVLKMAKTGHDRSCIEPGRRWIQRVIAHLELIDESTPDDAATSLVVDVDHFGRILAPITWHESVRPEWLRLANPLTAALGRSGNPVRNALGALLRDRVAASWPRKPTPPEIRERMQARRSELADLVPAWRHTIKFLRHVIAR